MNLDALPIPSENGAPARAKVTTLPDGQWTLAWARDGGLTVEPFGDPFPGPRSACRAAARLNARSGQ
jgi:hypothetical protein